MPIGEPLISAIKRCHLIGRRFCGSRAFFSLRIEGGVRVYVNYQYCL